MSSIYIRKIFVSTNLIPSFVCSLSTPKKAHLPKKKSSLSLSLPNFLLFFIHHRASCLLSVVINLIFIVDILFLSLVSQCMCMAFSRHENYEHTKKHIYFFNSFLPSKQKKRKINIKLRRTG